MCRAFPRCNTEPAPSVVLDRAAHETKEIGERKGRSCRCRTAISGPLRQTAAWRTSLNSTGVPGGDACAVRPINGPSAQVFFFMAVGNGVQPGDRRWSLRLGLWGLTRRAGVLCSVVNDRSEPVCMRRGGPCEHFDLTRFERNDVRERVTLCRRDREGFKCSSANRGAPLTTATSF